MRARGLARIVASTGSFLVLALALGAAPAVAQDTDGDGLDDAEEVLLGTDPNLVDTDGDTLGDGDEVLVYGTDPLVDADADGDGLPDAGEVNQGTSPQSADTDQDGVDDPDDVCPSAYDPFQRDVSGLGTSQPDGVGDMCQNADFDRDGASDVLDTALQRRALAGLEPDLNRAMPPQYVCGPGPDEDLDGDGFSIAQGDCDDCNTKRSPGALEIPGNGIDEDCDDVVDESPATCDAGLPLAASDPVDGARALELCKDSSGPGDWGLVSASWRLADGAVPPVGEPALSNFNLGHGVVGSFGTNVGVRTGSSMLVLSSGTARLPADPGYVAPVNGFDKGYLGSAPPGFPVESPSCPGVTTGTPHDASALEIVLRAPSNATGYAFDFRFFTGEWPDFICSQFNDFFLAIQSPAPAGSILGDVAFDAMANPLSVNAGFLEVCGPAGTYGGRFFGCPLGTSDLVGTGFETHGGTGWLTTQAPVTGGGEFTLRFVVYDSGDGSLDSTVVIDNFRWVTGPVGGPGTGGS